MKILDILNKANEGYLEDLGGDTGLGEYYDPDTGEWEPDAQGDGLAKFIVIELIETFDPRLTDEKQLEEGRRVMTRAIEELTRVFHALK